MINPAILEDMEVDDSDDAVSEDQAKPIEIGSDSEYGNSCFCVYPSYF